MIFELTSVIFRSLTFAFDVVQRIFDAIGLPWVAAVCMMVLVSVVLRLFTSQFIGSALGSPRPELENEARQEKAEKAALKENRRLDRLVKKESKRLKKLNRR